MKTPAVNLRTLDMLRGLLAVYVLLGHCRWLLWTGHAAWIAAPHSRWLEPIVYASALLRYGREAVMVFFVLSGFFIHLRAAQQPDEALRTFSAPAFYRRRLHRLGAPYAFALLVTIVLDAIGRGWFPMLYRAATGDALTDAIFSHAGYGAASVWPALLLLPSSLGYDFGSNGPLWSLAYEVVYYALYPVWLWMRRRNAALAYVVVPAACLLLAFVPGSTFPIVVLKFYPVWLTGALLAELLTRPTGAKISPATAAGTFVAGAGLYVFDRGGLLAAIPPMLFGGGAVALCALLRSGVISMPPVRLFEYFGVRSYTIYIVHFPLVTLMGAAAFASPGGRPTHGWYAAAGAVVAVAFGCLCFEVCERHFVHHRVPAARLAA